MVLEVFKRYGGVELLLGGYFRKVFKISAGFIFMEVVDLEDLLKKENFRVVIVNGDKRLFFKEEVNRFREEGYGVSEIDLMRFSTLKSFAVRFYDLSPNYALLNFNDFGMAVDIGKYLVSNFDSFLREGRNLDIAAAESFDYHFLSRSIGLSMAGRYWRYDFEGFTRGIVEKKPHGGFLRCFDVLQHKLEHLWCQPGFEGDDRLWMSFITTYGLAVGQGDQQELAAKLERLYSFVYGENLKDSVYHSDGSANSFSGN